MAKADAEIAVINTDNNTLTTDKLKTVKYFFIEGRPLICPKCAAKNSLKIEPIKKDVTRARAYCGGCDFEKIIMVQYQDKKVKSDILADKK